MQMRYRGIVKLVPVCAIWLAISVVALAALETPAQPLPIILSTLVCSVLVMICFWLSSEILFKRVSLNKQRLKFSRAWGKPLTYEWGDVANVRFRPVWQAFELEFNDQQRIKISIMMDNLKSFLLLMSTQLPAEQYQKAIEQFALNFGNKDD